MPPQPIDKFNEIMEDLEKPIKKRITYKQLVEREEILERMRKAYDQLFQPSLFEPPNT
jgi:hypothetical protein